MDMERNDAAISSAVISSAAIPSAAIPSAAISSAAISSAAVSSAAQTSTVEIIGTLVESLLYYYDDDTAASSTVVITFANTAAASSFTSEDSWFQQFPAAATTTAAAQTTSGAVEAAISAEEIATGIPSFFTPVLPSVNIQLKTTIVTSYAYPTSTNPTSSTTLPTFTPTIVTSYAYPTTSTSSSSTQPPPTFPPIAPSPPPPSSTAINLSPPPPSPSSPLPSPPLSSTTKTIISIGSSVGFLSLALLVFSIYRYLKHKQRSRQMHAANIPPILSSPLNSEVKEAENRLAMGSQELGFTGYGAGANGAVQLSKEEGRDGLAALHELGGVAVVDTLGELSGVSSGEGARGSGVRFVLGRTELA